MLFEAGLVSAQHLETHLGDPRCRQAKTAGSAMAEINDAMPYEGTSIIDSDHRRTAIPEIGHSDLRPKGSVRWAAVMVPGR